jgi:hypothetical protein
MQWPRITSPKSPIHNEPLGAAGAAHTDRYEIDAVGEIGRVQPVLDTAGGDEGLCSERSAEDIGEGDGGRAGGSGKKREQGPSH